MKAPETPAGAFAQPQRASIAGLTTFCTRSQASFPALLQHVSLSQVSPLSSRMRLERAPPTHDSEAANPATRFLTLDEQMAC